MATKRKTSHLWNHFSQNEDKKSAKCNYCSLNIGTCSGNTGNLTRHLNRKHPTIPVSPLIRQPVVPSHHSEQNSERLTEPASSQDTTDTNITNRQIQNPSQALQVPLSLASTSRQNLMIDYVHNTKPLPPQKATELDEQLLKMIAKEYHAFRIVEGTEFKKFLNMLNPRYSPPTRKTLANVLLPRLYAKIHHEVEQSVNAASAFCLTTDAWTSINNESFIAVTAHYIDSNWNLRSNLLCCIKYDERHTSDNLYEFMQEEIRKWQITHKVATIVSDNASNIVAAIQKGGWRHVGCFAHSLNLVVQTGISQIQSTVDKVKKIVAFFKRSSQAQVKLQEMQMPVLKLKQDVVTRWNSTYDMLNRFLTSKDAVVATLALVRGDLLVTPDEWEVIAEVLPILKIFYEVTTEISSEKQVTLSKVIVYSGLINQHIAKCFNQSHSRQTMCLLQSLEAQIHRRFYDKNNVESSVLHAEATILDPRFKSRGFRDTAKYEKAVAEIKKKVGLQAPANSNERQFEQALLPTATTAAASIWDQFDKEVSVLVPCNHVAAGIVECDKYLADPLLYRTGDPLKWWQERKAVYPILSVYMLKRLCLIATSVPCERTFSKAGLIMLERRTRLHSKKLAELLFIASVRVAACTPFY